MSLTSLLLLHEVIIDWRTFPRDLLMRSGFWFWLPGESFTDLGTAMIHVSNRPVVRVGSVICKILESTLKFYNHRTWGRASLQGANDRSEVPVWG